MIRDVDVILSSVLCVCEMGFAQLMRFPHFLSRRWEADLLLLPSDGEHYLLPFRRSDDLEDWHRVGSFHPR